MQTDGRFAAATDRHDVRPMQQQSRINARVTLTGGAAAPVSVLFLASAPPAPEEDHHLLQMVSAAASTADSKVAGSQGLVPECEIRGEDASQIPSRCRSRIRRSDNPSRQDM